MCRDIGNGGRRCYHGTEYERLLRNLQAKKQYHLRKGNITEAEAAAQKVDAFKAEHVIPHHSEHLEMTLSEPTLKVLKALTDAGLKPYIVGGSVRDALAGVAPKDIDIEVYNANEQKIVDAVRQITPAVNTVGQQFGVVKATVDDEEFDLSLPRTENKTGSAHTDFEVYTDEDLTIDEAVQRRDFTVNALLYDPFTGRVIDPTGGLEDWKDQTLKHVGDSFGEDPLRVLRAVQMSARFNMELHPDTVKVAKSLKSEFSNISKERVQIEFQKLFTKSSHPEKGMKVLAATGWDENFRHLKENNTEELHDKLEKAGAVADEAALSSEHRAALFGAIIAQNIPNNSRREFLSYITVGDKVKNDAYDLATFDGPSGLEPHEIRQWAHSLPKGMSASRWIQAHALMNPHEEEQMQATLASAEASGVSEGPEKDLINGHVMMDFFNQNTGGRWMKPALDAVRDAQYRREFDTLEGGMSWMEQNRERLSPPTR